MDAFELNRLRLFLRRCSQLASVQDPLSVELRMAIDHPRWYGLAFLRGALAQLPLLASLYAKAVATARDHVSLEVP